MSWFSGVSIDEQVEKATSENLPSGEQDLRMNMEICDLIRSKTVQPKDAMRSLKRRLLNKNPNVKIATLHLIDACIKNGGTHFLIEIASREFMDTVVLVLKPPSGVINREAQDLILDYVQNWANAFDGQLQLSYVNKVYNQLRSEGFQFKDATNVHSASFIDTSAPPEWIDSDTCMKSGTPFSFVNRKHHCRNCGGVYIQKHCQDYTALPHYGINEPVRVCEDCYAKLQTRRNPVSADQRPVKDTLKNVPGEDEDLKRALALSLEESKGQNFNAPPPPPPPPPAETNIPEEEDEDMKAAIEASLRDMERPNDLYSSTGHAPSNAPVQAQEYSQPQPQVQTQAQAQTQTQAPATPTTAPQEDEFTPLEEEILYRYVQLVEGLQSAPYGSILKDTKLQQLNDSVSALRPKLARSLGDTVDKYDRLVDMHGKLTTVVRMYDKILEDRLSNTMSPQHSGHYSAQSYYQPQAPPVNNATHPSYASAPAAQQYTSPPPSAPSYPQAPTPHQQEKKDEILIEL